MNILHGFLRRHSRIALDTGIFIYQIDENPRYIEFTDQVFDWLEQSGSSAVTSTVTMAELLVHPYREFDRPGANRFYALLSTYPNLDWVATSLMIADTTARIRAEHRLKTPYAVQAATAIRSGASGLITNDPAFKKVNGFETLVLDDLL